MNAAQRQTSLGFTAERFPVGTHMCLIYDNDTERRKLIAEFLGAGLREREQVAYFADTGAAAEVNEWLAEMGVGIPQGDRSEQFAVTGAAQAGSSRKSRL